MKRLWLIAVLVFSTVTVGMSAQLYQQGKTYKITILHTNDHHGHFWKNRRGEYGLAAQKTLVDRIRKEVGRNGGFTLVLSAGDVNTGVPESDLQDAEPDFKGMSMIGYDAMALGNHEFDNPLEVLKKQKEWAQFPFLAANVIRKSTGQPLFSPYAAYSFDGLRVAVFGLTTKDTPSLVTPTHVRSLRFDDPMKTARDLVPKLKGKAGLIIALTHLGHYEQGNYGSNAPGDLSLSKAVPGIDIIVGGHSHTRLMEPDTVNGTIVVQANAVGRYVGRLDIEFLDGVVSLQNYRLIPVNLKKKKKVDGKTVRVLIEEEIPEDPELLAFLQTYQDKGADELDAVIGSADGDLIGQRKIVRSRETNLGNLIARVQRLKVGADVGVMNSGGIRTSLAKGDITYKDVLKVQPFANSIGLVGLSGRELKQYLEVAANKSAGSGGFAQFDNVEIVMRGKKLESLKVGGLPVRDDKFYKLAINNFVATGGDKYMKVSDHSTYVDTGYIDADVLREYIQKNSPIRAAEFAPTNDVVRK